MFPLNSLVLPGIGGFTTFLLVFYAKILELREEYRDGFRHGAANAESVMVKKMAILTGFERASVDVRIERNWIFFDFFSTAENCLSAGSSLGSC
jgi:hypothetical protein